MFEHTKLILHQRTIRPRLRLRNLRRCLRRQGLAHCSPRDRLRRTSQTVQCEGGSKVTHVRLCACDG
jgi:hypothetical protein